MEMDADLQSLNQKYAIPGQVSFRAGPGNFVTAEINNAHASASVALLGARVISYQARGHEQLFWQCPDAANDIFWVMRGGAPVCWPWFAAHPTEPKNKPFHGLVGRMPWNLTGCTAQPDGSTELRMVVRDTPETLQHWPHAFELEMVVSIGQKLRIEWIARSPDGGGYSYTGAFHPYFHISNIRSITIGGLENTAYLDKTDQYQRKMNEGPLRITGDMDGIFLDTASEITIQDPDLGRTIHCAKEGSRTTVVWNPNLKDKNIPGLGEGAHRSFVCVEAANAAGDVVSVEAGKEGRLAMILWTEHGVPS